MNLNKKGSILMFDGKRLKELRKRKGLTQDDLGALVNVTKVSISCYESGIRIPNMETFLELVDVLGTTPNYLLGVDMCAYIKDIDSNYMLSCSLNDYKILKELKKNPKVYNMFRDSAEATIEYLEENYKN